MLTRITVMAHSDPKKPPKFGKPLKVRRPGEKAKPPPRGSGQSLTFDQLMRAMKGG